MIEYIINIWAQSLGNNPIVICLLIYSYFLYTIFFKKGEFKFISNMDELLKIILIFIGIFILLVPLIVYFPATINLLQGKELPSIDYFDISGLIIFVLIFSFISWIFYKNNNKFNLSTLWRFFNFLNKLALLILIIGIIISSFFKEYEYIKLPFMAMAIMFFIVICLSYLYNLIVIPIIPPLEGFLKREKDKNIFSSKKTMKKSVLDNLKEKLMEKEDYHLFGQILIIIGGFLIVKYINLIIPEFPIKKWIFFGVGFVFVWIGVNFIRKG